MTRRRNPAPTRGGAPAASTKDDALRFTGLSGALGAAGILVIAAGFHLLDGGSIALAPVLLVIGYGVLLPLALIR